MKVKSIKFTIFLLVSAVIIFGCITPVMAIGGKQSGDVTPLPNPIPGLEGEDAPQILVGKLINAIMGIVGSMALVMFIFGGIMWMLAAGNTERITRGKNILIWATVGLVVIFSSYAIVRFILEDALRGGG